MDQYGVLVFHDQQFDDETQLAFSRNFGTLEEASGDLNWGKARRIESALVNDISNLDNDNQVLARDNRRRLFSLGNRLWHSDSSFKEVPAKYSLLSARLDPVGRRQHRIRRHARGLRHAGRRNEGRDRGPGLRAQPTVLSRR